MFRPSFARCSPGNGHLISYRRAKGRALDERTSYDSGDTESRLESGTEETESEHCHSCSCGRSRFGTKDSAWHLLRKTPRWAPTAYHQQPWPTSRKLSSDCCSPGNGHLISYRRAKGRALDERTSYDSGDTESRLESGTEETESEHCHSCSRGRSTIGTKDSAWYRLRRTLYYNGRNRQPPAGLADLPAVDGATRSQAAQQ